VLAIELLTASQALDYRKPLRPGRGVEIAHEFIRERVPHRERDHFFQDDIAACLELVRGDALTAAVSREVGVLS
jgi:histidine ammonia-lyase